MKFVVSSFFCGLMLLHSPGCSYQRKKLLANNTAIAFAEDSTDTVEEIATVEDIATAEEITTTNTDLQNVATSLNFMNWYTIISIWSSGKFLLPHDFPKNSTKLKNLIASPYFWIAFWNGYEQHKNSTDGNKLDEIAIKNIFQKSTNIKNTEMNINKKGLKFFVDSIVTFASEAAAADSLSTTKKASLSAAIEDLTKGDGATNAVTHLEDFILHNLWYSINKNLESSHVVAQTESGKFYFKNGVFTENGLKKQFKVHNELSIMAAKSIRGLFILKESINTMMIPVLNGGQPNAVKATNDQISHINRIERFIQNIKNIFNVTTLFNVYTVTTTGSNPITYKSILTKEEFDKITNLDTGGFYNRYPFVGNHQLLEGGSSQFLNKITSTTNATALIPLLISTSVIN